MATSASTLLDDVNTAIQACLTSQQYTVRGRSQQRARLAELQAFRQSLISEINDSANGGTMATVGQIRGPQ